MVNPNQICYRCMAALPEEGAACPVCGAMNDALENQTNQLPIGSILAGKYLVGQVLGQGGFGITYIGWDMNLDVKIAIKEYYPEGFVGRDTATQCSVLPYTGEKGAFFLAGREKFVNEARILAMFAVDPGVVSVRDYFNENGTAYIIMDYLEGQTLKALAAQSGGKLPAAEVLSMLYPVMDTLSRIHKAGLLHRDISPDNIILQPDGRAVLLDFGAARQISAVGERSNTINVKHGFAPEEQYYTHGKQGPWSDVYALCATIYRLTTGVTPPQATDRALGDVTLSPPNALGADFLPTQEQALIKGLSVKSANRQQTVSELKQTLQNGLIKEPDDKPKRPVRKKWVFIGAGACVLIAVLVWVGTRPSSGKQPAVSSSAGTVQGGSTGASQQTGQTSAPVLPEISASEHTTGTSAAYEAALKQAEAAAGLEPLREEENQRGDYWIVVQNGTGRITSYTGSDKVLVVPADIGGTPITAIGTEAFAGCGSLVEVTLQEGIEALRSGAFSGCGSLRSITLPQSLSVIGEDAFRGCGALSALTVPEGVQELGRYALSDCAVLREVRLPASLRSIGNYCFEACVSLREITLPDGVAEVGSMVFQNCTALETIWLPASLTEIGSYAFQTGREAGTTLVCVPGSAAEAYAMESGQAYRSEADASAGAVQMQAFTGYMGGVITQRGTFSVVSGETSMTFYYTEQTEADVSIGDVLPGQSVTVTYPLGGGSTDMPGTRPPAYTNGPNQYFAAQIETGADRLKTSQESGAGQLIGGELIIGDLLNGHYYEVADNTAYPDGIPAESETFQAAVVYVTLPNGKSIATAVGRG